MTRHAGAPGDWPATTPARQTCSVNCGSRCVLSLQVADGRIQWAEGDGAVEEGDQMRPCLRGRALRYWLDSPERLNAPLRRVGPRGLGRFEPISWDEALDEVAERIRGVVARWGNEAVLVPYATARWTASGSPFERLMNCYGGHLGIYGDYSCAQLQAAHEALYGDDGYYSGSTLDEVANADLLVVFGANPSLTRMGGASGAWRLEQMREARAALGLPLKVVSVDPCHTDLMSRAVDEWLPVRPGTDAAFVAGVAHVLITEGLVDEAFVHACCIGYDAETMPAGVPESEGYRAYVMGDGPDGVEKTPAWAARITGCPSARIVSFARELAGARRAFVTQGWGPQRTEHGEQSARAVCLLAMLTGNLGLPGTNSGTRERLRRPAIPDESVGDNPVGVSIPAFTWSRAVEQGEALTAESAGVRGAERLRAPVKLIINHGGNALTNQHADINRTHRILADEGLCEFILGVDVAMTDSARYADILLPDLAQSEQAALVASGNSDGVCAVIDCESWDHPAFERRGAWDVARELARRLGVEEAFCAEGSTACEVDERRWEQGELAGEAGAHEELGARGVLRRADACSQVAFADFRADPARNPLPTPSGLIEIYSTRVAALARERAQAGISAPLSPIPAYLPAREGAEAACERGMLQLVSYHGRQSANSSFANVREIEEAVPRRLSINPIDAQRYGVASEDQVVLENERGGLVCRVRVTPRVMPGVVSLPQGAWHDADMAGDKLDWGGCANTLTSDIPTAWSCGNAHNSCLVRLRLLRDDERARRAKLQASRDDAAPGKGEGR